MVDVKPDEVSAILRQQLTNFSTTAELEEVGTVLQVGDGIARVFGLNKVRAGELVQFDSGLRGVVMNLEQDNVGIVLMGASEGVKEGDNVAPVLIKIASIKSRRGHAGPRSKYPGRTH